MKLKLSKRDIVVLVGHMGCGKSTLCSNLFLPHDVVESDKIRGELTGDFRDMSVHKETFNILYHMWDVRVASDIFTVIDTTGSRSVIDKARVLAKKYKRHVKILKMPHLKESELTEERLAHRYHVMGVLENQKKRIDDTDFNGLEVIDASTITSVEFKENTDIFLDAKENYVVVPDLHGEYGVVDRLMTIHDPSTKFIFLGDIVDRGESSYKTFSLVNELIKNGGSKGVISNHDNKFYRWLKKWNKDSLDNQSTFSEYGMTLAYGLNGTINEFYTLGYNESQIYCDDFVNYYEKLPPYLILEKGKDIHYFAHAGISNSVASGRISKSIDSTVMYDTLTDIDVAYDMVRRFNEVGYSYIHLGHDAQDSDVWTKTTKVNVSIVKHDIGIGKTKKAKDIHVHRFLSL